MGPFQAWRPGVQGPGYSIDLTLRSPTDERGFYQRPAAVQFLLAIDAAARAAGVQWRAIYNDYAVAAAVNRHLEREHVILIGEIRRGASLGLNWHGPLMLHFHLDIVPLSPGPDREEPAASYTETAGGYDLEEEWAASAEELDGSEALDVSADEAESFAADELENALFEGEESADEEGYAAEEKYAGKDEESEQLVEPSALGTFETLAEAENGPGSRLADRVRGVVTFVFGPTLRRGSRGPAVAARQRTLGSLGYDVVADGDFGPATERAVRAAQGRLGLTVDGIVGSQTKAAIGAALSGRGSGAAAPTEGGPPAPTGAPATGASAALNGRILRVMELLIDQYGYRVNGAAGLAGNLIAESSVLPNRVEGSRPETPMRARDFAGDVRDFTPEEVRDRSSTTRRGPLRPGIGIAQWTSRSRREGLFQHICRGQQLGVAILSDLDAQVDYLVTELRRSYSSVNATLTASRGHRRRCGRRCRLSVRGAWHGAGESPTTAQDRPTSAGRVQGSPRRSPPRPAGLPPGACPVSAARVMRVRHQGVRPCSSV